MSNIVYFDADFIIRTSRVQKDSSTLFDKIMELPYTFRITDVVLREIRDKAIIKQLSSLQITGKLQIAKISECIYSLKQFLTDDAICSLVVSTLKAICDSIHDDSNFFNNYFKSLETLSVLNSDVGQFISELDDIVINMPKDNNIGEIITLLNISLTNRIENVQVISLLSHDSAARRGVLTLHENVNSFDCYSCFYLLKINNILDFNDAKKYASSWLREFPRNDIVTIMENRSKGINIRSFIEIIFNSSEYKILRNGMLKK